MRSLVDQFQLPRLNWLLPAIAGIYAMNFEQLPELGTEHGYFVVQTGAWLAGIAALPVVRFIHRQGVERRAAPIVTLLHDSVRRGHPEGTALPSFKSTLFGGQPEGAIALIELKIDYG